MGTTVAALRTDYLNTYLARTDGTSRPWTDAELNRLIGDVLNRSWPDLGIFTYAETAADGTQFIDIPAAFTGTEYKLSRMILLDQPAASGGTYSDDLKGWRKHPVGDQIVSKAVRPNAGVYVGFYGYVPLANDGSNLPARLFSAMGQRAAGLAYGKLAAELLNSERQQNLDSGRVVDYQTAVAFAAFWERQYQDATASDPLATSTAPRSSSRTR